MPAHRLKLRIQLMLGLGMVVALSLLVGVLAYLNTQSNREAMALVQHTDEVIAAADALHVTVDDIDEGYGALLLSGSEAALAMYENAASRYPSQIERLIQLTADNPPQVARWRAIGERLDHLRTTVLDQGVALRLEVNRGLASPEDVIRFDASGDDLRGVAEVRNRLDEATTVERDLLHQRIQAADASNALLSNVLMWGQLAVVLLGMCIAVLAANTIGGAMTRLAAGAQAIAAGDLSRRVRLQRRDEIGRAAAAFNRMAESLQRQSEDRRAVERMKNEFVSVVSHELRTPLTSIRGSLGLLQAGLLGPMPPKGVHMLEVAVNNTDRLIRLINDMLDIERIESGRVFLDLKPTNSVELVQRSVESLRSLAEGARIRIHDEQVESIDLLADGDGLVRTLTNLIGNAIKFSPADSSIEVSARREADHALFSVRDHGRGIPTDKLESIFGRFEQVDTSDARARGGTGLGLAISRSIVQKHGGRIWVESMLDEGSTFYFTVPLRAAPGSRAGPPPRVPAAEHAER